MADVSYHIAIRTDWERAMADGDYPRSTMDKTLVEERFIHASQVARTANKFYRGVPEGLVPLIIDEARVHAEVRCEDVPVAGGTFAFQA